MDNTERVHLRTTPSQMVNIGHYGAAFVMTLLAFFGMLSLPDMRIVGMLFLTFFIVPYVVWRYLVISCTVYEVTSERIKHRHGVLNKTVNELELYRVRDYQVQQPFWLRLVGCGNVVVISADRTSAELVLWAVTDSEKVANTLRSLVEQSRRTRGVRDLDVGSAPMFDE